MVGDQVYLKLQPYVQTSVANRSSQKLGFKYFGPYTVLQRVGQVSYKLQLPDLAKIHNVIHVSQLKKALKPTDQVSAELPLSFIDVMLVQPVAVVGERMVRRGSKQVPQVKLQWSGLPPHCQTWEHLGAIVAVFPSAPAWGQAATQGGGIVTTTYLPVAIKAKLRTDARQRIREAHLLTKGAQLAVAEDTRK